MKKPYSNAFLTNKTLVMLLILLLEGFVTISVEVLTIRQLLPFYGGSVLMTSLVIGVFLLFLALGYWRGGYQHDDVFSRLSRNFILSMIWIGLGLSYVAISLFFYLTVYYYKLPFLFSLFLYLTVVLAPIVYWLGQTVPLTTNLFSQKLHVSHISGKALFLSTIGSFLGAILTSLLFFHYLGVAWTIVINCFLLFFLIIVLRKQSHVSMLTLVLILCAFLYIMNLNVAFEKKEFQQTNNYGNYQVVTANDFSKTLVINQSISSLRTPANKGFPYIEYVRTLLFDQLKLQHKRILVIGAGGFSLTAAGHGSNDVTYIDIDPSIKQLAEEKFLEQPIQGKFIGQDARRYLRQNDSLFDVIFSDAYSNQNTIPAPLLTVEYFQSLADHLMPEGLLVVNLIANPLFDSDYAQIVFNSIHAVFPYCAVIPLNWAGPSSNILYICPKKAVNHRMYRDDLTTATSDFFYSRQQMLRSEP